MSIQVYADDALVYDSRLALDPQHANRVLLGLKTTTGLNKGGTLALILPPGHPCYNSFVSYKTVVTLYDDGVLQFRGRVLYPSDDFYNNRTVTCEGERCFLRDAYIRPYLFMDTPAAIFDAAIMRYNSEVDEFKRFTPGVVTVSDSNDYVRLESQSAETFADFFDKLVERCGGYITFTDDGAGGRAINWLADVGTESNQAIEFGSNLLEFARSGQTDELATAVLPYGAQLEDGTRVTIASVNNGQDWIQDDAAVALRGRIVGMAVWDDVEEPANLLTKARAWLAEHKLAVTSLELTAVDLSKFDRTLNTYHDGDRVPVRSKAHDVDELFRLTDRTIDWLNPEGGNITLGKSKTSMTGSDVRASQDVNAKINILNNAVINGKLELQETTKTLTSKIEQSSTSILLEVSETYATKAGLSTEVQSLNSKIETLAGSITLEVSGSLGNSASIKLNVDGDTYTETLDLSEVRQAFADDTSTITISAGKITFNSGTLVINSGHFNLSADGYVTATGGTIAGWTMDENSLYYGTSFTAASAFLCCTGSKSSLTIAGQTQTGWVFKAGSKFGVTSDGSLFCTNANLSGTLQTESGYSLLRVTSGGIDMYCNDVICGRIQSSFYSGQLHPGVAIEVRAHGEYLCFRHEDPMSAGTIIWDYVLNNGYDSLYKEMHLFQTSARFLDKVYFSGSGAYFTGAYLFENYFIKAVDSDGNVGEELLGYQATNDRVCLGSNYCTTLLRGSTVYLKNTSTTVTSDRNAKHSIEELPDAYEVFVDNLAPVRFKYNEGTSDRYHVGFIAQDVKAALDAAGLSSQDFAGYVDIDHTGELGLQYTEFIAVLLKKIKRLEERVAALPVA
jgi:hypothetical protein